MNRVKSLSKSGNPKKDQAPGLLPSTVRESSSAISLPDFIGSEDVPDQIQEKKVSDMGKRVLEKDNFSYSSTADYEKQQSSLSSNYSINGREQTSVLSSSYPFNGKEEGGVAYTSSDRERVDSRFGFGASGGHKVQPAAQNSNETVDGERVKKVSPPRTHKVQPSATSIDSVEGERVKKVSPPRRKFPKEEKLERPPNFSRKDDSGSALPTLSYKQQIADSKANIAGSREYDADPPHDEDINAILEASFEGTWNSYISFYSLFIIVNKDIRYQSKMPNA